MANGIGTAFHRIVEEGTHRLHRRWPALLATGAVGGIDVSVGVLAMLLVMHRTGDELLAALAFSIGSSAAPTSTSPTGSGCSCCGPPATRSGASGW